MINKAVIPIAGYGTRMLPATMSIPKTMLNIVDRPIIEYIIDEIVEAGINNILLITNLGSSIVENHFARSYELEHFLEKNGEYELLANIKNRYQGVNIYIKKASSNESLAQSIYDAKSFVDDETFLLALGDEIFDTDISCSKKLVDIYNKYSAQLIAVKNIPKDKITNYGIVEGYTYMKNIFVISNMIEKPNQNQTNSDLAIVGRYILNNSIFKEIEKQFKKNEKCSFTKALLEMKDLKFAVKIEGNRFDCGSKLGLLEANINFGLKNKEIKEELKEYMKSLL